MKYLSILLMALLASIAFVGCDEGPAEDAGESIDESVEDVQDTTEDAMDDAEDTIE